MKTNAVDNGASPAPTTRRLKIAVLNRIFSTAGGGAERYSVALVEQLATRHDIHVFAQEINHQWPGVTYHRIPCISKKPRWLNQLWYAYATWRATRTGFDIVHSHENVWHGNVQTMHVKSVRRNLLEERKGWRLALRWVKIGLSPRLITYMALEHARMSPIPGRAIVAVSHALQSELVAQYPKSQALVSVITPGVALPVEAMTPAQARTMLGVPVDGQYLLFVANDYTRKGLATLLQALQGMDGVRLLVVGHPGQIEHYQTVARTQGLQGRVHFLGTLQSMASAYFAADVLAHPTLEDSFAMVVLEAMAHGVPVVVSSSRYCGIASLLRDKVNALILENPQDAEALRMALLKVLDDTLLRAKLTGAGAILANQHSLPGVATAYQARYAQLT